LGEAMLEGSLLCIAIIIQDSYYTLEFCIVLAEFLVSLGELVEFCRCSSYLVGISKGGFEDGDKYLHIIEFDFIREDVRLDLVLCMPLEEAIHIAELMLVIGVLGGFSSKLGADLGDNI
jgi:hypothetical protein